mgnify:CR=1 FL=1
MQVKTRGHSFNPLYKDWMNMAKKNLVAIAAKSTKTIMDSVASLQARLRTVTDSIGDALIEKNEELSEVLDEIKDKKAELAELIGKEDALLQLEDLKLQVEDAQKAHERKIAEQAQELADAKIRQELADKEAARLKKIDDEYADRIARLAAEDLNRKAAQDEEDRKRELDLRDTELKAREEALGNVQALIDEAVSEANSKKEREMAMKERAIKAEADQKVAVSDQVARQYQTEIYSVKEQLKAAQKDAELANARAQALAISMADKESGKDALDRVEKLAMEVAKGKK